MMTAIAGLGVLCLTAQLLAQVPGPSFEAASIKPSKATDDSSSWNSRTGYLVMRNQTLNACIRIAYGLKADQITGGPRWLDSDRFDIEARAASPAKDPELLAMLQTLLDERFQLKQHRSSKLVAGYSLAVAKGGLKVHPVEATGSQRMNWGKGRLLAERASMARFADALTRILGTPVVDATGIPGEYSFQLEWTPEVSQPVAVSADAPADIPAGPSLLTVLQQDLGLKLEPTKAPIDILIIDRAEKPTEN
jgi:uncharacterized protein (TIGR03435 family)